MVTRIRALVKAFQRIRETRMTDDMPMVHPVLEVEAVGFRAWDEGYLGVLITPWFMNVMILPEPEHRFDHLGVCDEIDHVLPAGAVRFIVGEEESFGRYQMSSLFSPMFAFEDQEAARIAAHAAMEALMVSPEEEKRAARKAKAAEPVDRREAFRRLVGGRGE